MADFGVGMSSIPRKYSHFVYGTLQSGLTCAIAAAVANYPLMHSRHILTHWIQPWLFSWSVMLPVVLFAAPIIRSLALALTGEE
jgi:FtsH-binding integral membrane protein